MNKMYVYTKSHNSDFNKYSVMPLFLLRKKQMSAGVRLDRSCYLDILEIGYGLSKTERVKDAVIIALFETCMFAKITFC